MAKKPFSGKRRRHRILTVTELADYFKIHRATLHRLIKIGSYDLNCPYRLIDLIAYLLEAYGSRVPKEKQQG